MFFRKLAANQRVLWEGIYSGVVPSSQAFISTSRMGPRSCFLTVPVWPFLSCPGDGSVPGKGRAAVSASCCPAEPPRALAKPGGLGPLLS